MNLPNKLTIARVCMIPAFVVVLQIGISADLQVSMYIYRLVATGIFILAAATDWLDGFLARKLNLITDFGKFMDPLADKILVMAAMVYLVVLGDIEPWVLIIIEGREFIIAGVRMVAASNNVVIAAGIWGKLKTIVQMIMIPVVLLDTQHFLPETLHAVFNITGQVLIYAAVALTVISAASYIWHNKSVFKKEVA